MTSFASRTAVLAPVVGLLGLTMTVGIGGLGACSGATVAGIGEGASSGSSGASGTSGSSGSSGSSGTSGGIDGGAPDGASQSCVLTTAPASAAKKVAIKFESLDTTGGTQTGWSTRGFDRDGLCTTKLSTDVCQRQPGAAASAQEDGPGGIDNAWGHIITPLLGTFSPSLGAGYLMTDANGDGTIIVAIQGVRLVIPVTLARVLVQGTTATVSAIVPTEAFTTELAKAAGRLSASLCAGSTIESIKQSVRQASDVPLDLIQRPEVPCTAISLGATLTGVADGTAPIILPPPDPCL